jgi:UDP-N-acetylmuramoyl-tripeptide--D-alanyl-D-alanine ligase
MVLGGMMELGAASASAHLEIARQAVAVQDARVVFVGSGFQEAAVLYDKTYYPDVNALIRDLGSALPEGSLILVKGSRAMRLEALLDALQ